MDDGADASREYDRLRAELADFVLETLTERLASGEEPRLSQALVEAIDRRVEAAVEARLAHSDWPDPNEFADSVLAAAAARGGNGDRLAATVSRTRAAEGRSVASGRAPAPTSRLTNVQIGIIAVIGFAIVAFATIYLLRGMSGPVTTMVRNEQSNRFEPVGNDQQPPGDANAATSAGAVTNVQGGTR